MRRIERVRVQLRHRVVELPWSTSRELVSRLIAAGPNGQRIADKFNAAGVSRPVVVDQPDEEVLLEVLEQWVADEGVWEGASDGTREILDILGSSRAGEGHDRH